MKSRRRLLVLYLGLAAAFVVFGSRLVQLQVVEADQLTEKASLQRSCRLKIAPDRGRIFDRNGEVMAISVEKDTIYATPYLVNDKRTAARKIARILDEKPSAVYDKLTKKSGFEYLRRKADQRIGKRIKALDIDGIGVLPESERFYPGKTIASHMIGFVGLDNVGLTGLEMTFDKELRGKPGSVEMEQDMEGRPIPGTDLLTTQATHGRDIVLTIDKEIQYKAQVELKKAVKEWKADGGWIIVMGSQTGEIYAMALEPTYNLNKFAEAATDTLKNRVVTDVYEPGSTLKIVTASAVLEEGLSTTQQTYALPGTVEAGGFTIGEAHARGSQTFTFTEIVTRSSNVGAVTLARSLGEDKLYKYADAFGMNAITGIDIPGEAQGYLPTTDQWSASTLATVSFGQGISATALENIRAVNVIATGGRLVKPHTVMSIIDSAEDTQKHAPRSLGKRVISRETADTMSDILRQAVEVGTGKAAQIEGYSAAGKTGTAQKPRKDKPGYEGYISSFIGFTPAEDPEITILVAIDEPKDAIYGGVVAAPVFAEVGEFALQRLKVIP